MPFVQRQIPFPTRQDVVDTRGPVTSPFRHVQIRTHLQALDPDPTQRYTTTFTTTTTGGDALVLLLVPHVLHLHLHLQPHVHVHVHVDPRDAQTEGLQYVKRHVLEQQRTVPTGDERLVQAIHEPWICAHATTQWIR